MVAWAASERTVETDFYCQGAITADQVWNQPLIRIIARQLSAGDLAGR